MVWYNIAWCGVVWCGVVWCGVVWCGVVWCGMMWCGVVWCGMVWPIYMVKLNFMTSVFRHSMSCSRKQSNGQNQVKKSRFVWITLLTVSHILFLYTPLVVCLKQISSHSQHKLLSRYVEELWQCRGLTKPTEHRYCLLLFY